MTVLDAFAVVALLRDEPAAAEVQALLEQGDARLTAVGPGEVLDHLVRIVGVADEEAVPDLAQLGLDEAMPVDADLARRAALLRARHSHRTRRAVSLADCIAAEAARALGAPLATADPQLLDLCRDDGIVVIPLPDSTGASWAP